MLHRSRYMRLLVPALALVALLAVTGTSAGAGTFHFKEGTFVGKSGLDGGRIELEMKRKTRGLFIRHIVVKGSFDCYGYPEEVDIDRYSTGYKVGRRGGFRIPDADVSLRGHYVTSGRIEGSLVAKTFSCDSPQEHFGARRR
jgi:hypothetical protein